MKSTICYRLRRSTGEAGDNTSHRRLRGKTRNGKSFFCSNHYIEPLNIHTIRVAPGALQFQLWDPSMGFASKAVIKYPDGKLQPDRHALRFAIFRNDTLISPWTKMCQHPVLDRCDSTQTTFSLMIHSDDTYILSFKEEIGDSVYYDLTIACNPPTPQLEGWRELGERGTSDDTIFGEEVIRKIANTEPIQKSGDTVIQAKKDGFISFSFKEPYPWADSVMEYQWQPADGNHIDEWKPMGSWLTLPVQKKNNWILKVRTNGNIHPAKYYVVVAPSWYEKPLFILILVLLAVTGLVLSYYWWHHRKLKLAFQYQSQLTQQLMVMQSQLAPHMMFNSLTALQDLIENRKWSQVKKFTDELNTLLKDTFLRKAEMYSKLQTELSNLEHFIGIQQLRFGFNYKVEVENPDWLNAMDIPTGLVQPVVENAIKYNLSNPDIHGNLHIRVFADRVHVSIHISASNTSKVEGPFPIPKTSTGFGLSWVKTRIKIHNLMYPYQPIILQLNLDPDSSEVNFKFCNKIKS